MLGKRSFALVGAIVIAGAVVGCSSDDSNDSSNNNGSMSMTPAAMSTMQPGAAADGGALTGAATLRAGLTALLQEHVYLAGFATDAALNGGDFEAAAAALDTNSVDLSKAIGSVYGTDAETAFLSLWRTHIGFFVDYTQGSAAGDAAKVTKARADLDMYRADFGAFLASANPNLTKEAVAEELKMHTETLFAAIDAQAAGSAEASALLRTAAGHMPHTAEILASAIVKQMPAKFDGAADSGGATLRSGLTALLQEHVYLAGNATGAALAGGDFTSAADVLDTNSVDLSKAIGSVYGAEAEGAFLSLWRTHIGFFVDYTQGKAAGDTAKVTKARTDLDTYRSDFGAFIASANPNLTKEAVAEELKMHTETLFAAIDAQAAGDEDAFAKLRTAASHMPHTAEVLAGAIAKQMPQKYSVADPADHSNHR